VGKRFNAVYNVYAWIWNHFWGTLFLVGGVWGLFAGLSIWVCLLGIGVGIYFYASGRFEAKVGAVASKAATAVGSEVNKEKNAEIDRAAAAPVAWESPASAAEVVSALDAILNARWFDAYYGSGLQVSERALDRIVYTFRAPRVPRAAVVEVRVEAGDAATQVVFKCLHQDDSSGLRPYADLVARLRETVECAVDAAGDSAKIAEGAKLYGPPEKGSPTAIKVRNGKIAMSIGFVICAIPLFELKQGIPAQDLPMWIVVELVGLAVAYAARRWSKSLSTPRTFEALTASVLDGSTEPAEASGPTLAQAPSPAATQAQEAAASAANAVKAGVGAARTWFFAQSAKRRALVVGAAVVVVVGAVALSIAGSGNASDSANGSSGGSYQADANNPGGTGGDYTPPADTAASADPSSGDAATTDGSTPAQVTNNAAPMSAAPADQQVSASPDTHARALEDLLATAPADGTQQQVDVVYLNDGYTNDADTLSFTVTSRDPQQWYVLFALDGQVAMNADGIQVSLHDFLARALSGNAYGTVTFTKDRVVSMDLVAGGE
jgi:hypothetical protein